MRRELGLGLDWMALLALGLAGATAYGLFLHSKPGAPVVFGAIVALALVASILGRHRSRPDERRPWLLTSVALVGFLAADAIWWRYAAGASQTIRLVDDGAIFASYAALGLAALSLGSSHERRGDHSSWLDAGILTALTGLIAWSVLVEPRLHDSKLGSADKLAIVGYPLAGLFVLAFVFRLAFSRSGRSWASTSFMLGVALILGSEVELRWHDTRAALGASSRVDIALLIGYLLVGFAALLSPAVWKGSSGDRTAMGRGRLVVVLLAAVVPQVVLFSNLERRKLIGLDTLNVSVWVSSLVMVLVAVRLWRLLKRVRRAEAHRGEARLAALIHNSADAILLVDRECVIAFASRSSEGLWQRNVKSLVGASLFDSFVEDDRHALARQLENLVAMSPASTLPLEGRIRTKNGKVWALEGTGCNLLDDENVGAIVITLRDTTSRRELEAQLERRAFHDSLTGLANRALFSDRITHALNRVAREPEVAVAVLLIDLDDFKAVNDGMGHGAGDELIRGVAARIQGCLRPADTVARLGGDEFAVLLEDLPSIAYASNVADRLVAALQLPIDVIGLSLAVPASIGVTFASHESTVESLLRDADIALYSAKARGKGSIALFDETLRDIAVRRLELKVELPEALRCSQFRVVYQPIKNVGDETLKGFEALLRWHHPQRGAVSPAEFIPAAEETGAIIEMGRWVLREACRQAVEWNRRSLDPLSMSVNVSGVQLHNVRFVDDLREILEETGHPASLLTLELTESVLVERMRVQKVLGELREIGVGVSIDDFGTGYSSLSYLQNFPVTAIKVDQSFVADLSSGDAGLVRSILSIADALGLTTVAEGVEDARQLELLDDLGCELAQGFYLGRPQKPGEIDGLLEIEKMARSAKRRIAQGHSAPVLLSDR